MKKSLLALAVLGAFAGVASAQSSVTIFGIVDANVRHVKTGDTKLSKVDSNGLSTGRLGFKGVEDLGGGLKAGFELQSQINADDGTTTAKLWHRRAVVYLNGGFGEVRLGRDYLPTFWNLDGFDPFGTTGTGSSLNVISTLGSGASTLVRADNAAAYFLPSGLGGFYGQVTVAAGEGVNTNKYAGGRVGYAAGPLNVAVAYGQTEATPAEDFKAFNLGASYNLGMLKLMGFYNKHEFGNLEQQNILLGVSAPVGPGEVRASYQHADADGGATNSDDASQIAVGYVYNLSKRTALYGTVSRIKNKGAATFTVAGAPAATAGAQNTSTGVEAGIKHSF